MEKILIIENDIFLADVLLKKLKGEGYDATLARDAAQGNKMMRELKPSLVVVDVDLPVVDGYKVLEDKQKDPAVSRIPVIVIFASNVSESIEKVLSLGAKDFLIKQSFDPEEALTKIKMQLKSTQSAPASKAAPISSAASVIKDKKVMWVEDDEFLSEIIGKKLAGQGAKLLHAGNGEEALRIAADEHPEVVLLDIILPGLDGFEILRQLKDKPETKTIPVIMLSNLGQKSDIEKGIKLGAAKFLIKATVTLDEIMEEIVAVVNKK
jgi:DNA-binding response OmpR family regulator